MINTSNEYKERITESREFYNGLQITLTDSTVLNVNDSHLRAMKISDITSKNGYFTFGALINELTCRWIIIMTISQTMILRSNIKADYRTATIGNS